MSSPEQVEQDRRSAVNTYFQLLQHHTDFIERTHETFNTIESHLYQLIQHYNEELEELPLNTRTRTRNTNNTSRTSTANRTNIRTTRGRSPPSLFNTTNIPTSTMRNPFSSTPLFNELGNSRRRTPAFSPSQNVLDTITLWALFPNGISANNNLESLSPVIVRPTPKRTTCLLTEFSSITTACILTPNYLGTYGLIPLTTRLDCLFTLLWILKISLMITVMVLQVVADFQTPLKRFLTDNRS